MREIIWVGFFLGRPKARSRSSWTWWARSFLWACVWVGTWDLACVSNGGVTLVSPRPGLIDAAYTVSITPTPTTKGDASEREQRRDTHTTPGRGRIWLAS